VEENGRCDRTRPQAQISEEKGRKEYRKVPPLICDDRVRYRKDRGRDQKSPADIDAQKSYLFFAHDIDRGLEISTEIELLRQRNEKELKYA